MVQIGWAIHQVVAGKFPLSEVAGLPFVERIAAHRKHGNVKASHHASDYRQRRKRGNFPLPGARAEVMLCPKSSDKAKGRAARSGEP